MMRSDPVDPLRREIDAASSDRVARGRIQRPKVAILTNIPAPYRLDQLGRLAARGSNEYVVYFCAVTEPNRRWRVPDHYPFRHEVLGARAHTFLGGYSYFVPGFLRRLLKEKPRVVIVGGFSLQLLLARVYGWISNAGVIVLSDTNILCERALPAWRTALRRCLVRGIDGALACSRLGVEYLRFLGVPADRIVLSRCVNDAPRFSAAVRVFRRTRSEGRRLLGVPSEAVLLLFVGRFEVFKGVLELLEAFGRLRKDTKDDVRLLMVGEGSLGHTLQEMVEERGLGSCVTFTGFKPYDEMPSLYALADLAVVPSLKEPYGLVVNEAIAAGLPLLCSVFVGARDLLEDGRRGLLFDPRDAREFQKSLRTVIDRLRKATWDIPEEIPQQILPDSANAAIESLVERVVRSRAPGVAEVEARH